MLSSEDKKRVLVESGAETQGGQLEWQKVVAAMRMLGSSFFQDYTGQLKTYDHMAFNVEEADMDDDDAEAYWTHEDTLDDDTIVALANKNNEGVAMVVQFEDAVSEAVQSDPDLAVLFTSYQDARRRLTERVRFRGFWPVKKGSKGAGEKGENLWEKERWPLPKR